MTGIKFIIYGWHKVYFLWLSLKCFVWSYNLRPDILMYNYVLCSSVTTSGCREFTIGLHSWLSLLLVVESLLQVTTSSCGYFWQWRVYCSHCFCCEEFIQVTSSGCGEFIVGHFFWLWTVYCRSPLLLWRIYCRSLFLQLQLRRSVCMIQAIVEGGGRREKWGCCQHYVSIWPHLLSLNIEI